MAIDFGDPENLNMGWSKKSQWMDKINVYIMKSIMNKYRKINVYTKYYMKTMKNGSQNIGNFEPPHLVAKTATNGIKKTTYCGGCDRLNNKTK